MTMYPCCSVCGKIRCVCHDELDGDAVEERRIEREIESENRHNDPRTDQVSDLNRGRNR